MSDATSVIIDRTPQADYQYRLLFAGEVLRIGHVSSQPWNTDLSEVGVPTRISLFLPLQGMFARHDGPRRHVIAAPGHGLFYCPGRPYRTSFPNVSKELSLALSLPPELFAQVFPHTATAHGFFPEHCASNLLLSPQLMLARGLLSRQLADGEPLEIEEAALNFFGAVLREAGGAATPPHIEQAATRLRQIERIKEAVAIDPARKWTLSALAEIACISPFHLAHIFSTMVGTPVHRYVLRARLAASLDWVLESDRDLAAIALDTGFASHSHFTARFRTLFGTTPADLRRTARSRTAAHLREIAAE
jgi:AraC family transcriptional regulator